MSLKTQYSCDETVLEIGIDESGRGIVGKYMFQL